MSEMTQSQAGLEEALMKADPKSIRGFSHPPLWQPQGLFFNPL